MGHDAQLRDGIITKPGREAEGPRMCPAPSRRRRGRESPAGSPRPYWQHYAPNEEGRIWVIFDWDEEGWKSLISDTEVPAIFQEAGVEGRPQAAELVRQHDA
jgi:hypothetical protein